MVFVLFLFFFFSVAWPKADGQCSGGKPCSHSHTRNSNWTQWVILERIRGRDVLRKMWGDREGVGENENGLKASYFCGKLPKNV